MKVCIVTHNYPTNSEPYLQSFIRDQVRVISDMKGYQPRVLVPSPFVIPYSKRWKLNRAPLLDSEITDRFNYISIPKRIAPRMTGRNLARNLLKKLNGSSDLLHIHWLYPNGITIPILKEKGFRCVLNIHGTDWHSTKNDPRFSLLIKETLDCADLIVVSGKEIKKEILNRNPALDVRVSYNYIDTDLFQFPSQSMVHHAQQSLNFDPKKLNILTVANIRPEKGIDLYLDAISQLNLSNICFHIIGQSANGSYAELISKKLYNLSKNTVKFHSPVSRQIIPLYYYAADAYLLPSRSEGFNVSLLEALATGLPIIATKTGGATDVLNDDRGTLVDPGNPTSLANAIESLYDNQPLERSEKSRKFITDNFSFHQYSKFLDNLYSSFNDIIENN